MHVACGKCIYVLYTTYIYIYTERERDIDIDVNIDIVIETYILHTYLLHLHSSISVYIGLQVVWCARNVCYDSIWTRFPSPITVAREAHGHASQLGL